MSSNYSIAQFTNQTFNNIADYNIEEEMLEIMTQQQVFSSMFDEILGINIQSLEEKQIVDLRFKKIKSSPKKIEKIIYKRIKSRRNTKIAREQPIMGLDSFKKNDVNNDHFKMPEQFDDVGEWQKAEQEAKNEQPAIPQQQNGSYCQYLLLQSQQNIIKSNSIHQNMNQNICTLKNSVQELSSSSSSLFSV